MINQTTQHPYTGSTSRAIITPIVLLNGWGMSAQAWQSIIPFLQQWSDVVVIDVVYESDVDVLCEKLCETLYENLDQGLSKPCILMGWSLGGMLATRIAAMYPQSVSGLITLASNAQFVASDDWPTAMAEEVFAGFHQAYTDNAEKALQRFSNLVVQGDLHRREQKRYLQSLLTSKQAAPKVPAPQQLSHYLSGLDLLRDINNQTALQKINCPTLHCYGENDALLPVRALKKIKNLNVHHQYEMIAQAGHLLHMPSERLERVLNHFFTERFFMSAHKKNIADSFSRSAVQYDQAANVQQQSGKKLLAVMNQVIKSQSVSAGKKITIADVGCGTGFFTRQLIETYQPQKYIGVDIAEGMLVVAKENNADCKDVEWLRCEAENLLLEDESVDIIFANFSLQWCEDLPALMKSFYRVLAPNGFCCFTSLGVDTLSELRQAWGTVDQLPHVNQFHRRSQWQSAIENNNFLVANNYHETVTEYFDSVVGAMRGLKEVGANVVTTNHRQGLTGKQLFNQFIQVYETHRTPQGIPASYDVDGWIIQKKGET